MGASLLEDFCFSCFFQLWRVELVLCWFVPPVPLVSDQVWQTFVLIGWWLCPIVKYYKIIPLLWNECVPLPHSYVEILVPSVAIFRDRVVTEVIQVKWGHEDSVFIRKDTRDCSLFLSLPIMWGHSWKAAVCNSRKEPSPNTSPPLLAPWSCTYSLQNCEK